MRRARIVGSCSLDDGGGVAAVCRSMAAALEEAGVAVEHVDSHALVQRNRLTGALPGRRHWQGIAEVALSAQAVANRAAVDLTLTNGPVGWGIDSPAAVHFYHGTYAGQAQAVRGHIRTRGYLKLRFFDSGILERFAGRQKLCLANSQQTAREVRRFFGHQAETVWCEVDTDTFRPGSRDRDLLETLGVGDDSRRVGLFVGAGRPMKGEVTAFDVMEQIPEIDWLVLGEEDRVPPRLRSQISVKSGLPHDAMPDLLRSIDVLLAPSLYEPFGILVAESLASGTPVVASAQGVVQLVGDVPGFDDYVLHDPRNPVTVTHHVKAVLENYEKSGEVVLAARERIHDVLAPPRWRRRFLESVGFA